MKKVQLEPWGTFEKFCLASAAPNQGEQNWNVISRNVKNTYEESTRFFSEDKRSMEWFSQKQCMAQYENFMKNVVPRKKRRTDKGVDFGDNIGDSVVQNLKQEYIVELGRLMAEEQALYLKLFKEREDINTGRLDHKLEDMSEEIEAKEREKEIKIKLKFKLGEKNLDADSANKSKETEMRPPTETPPPPPMPEPTKTSVTTSPLLTSLLQSPSPLTRPSLPLSTSPTISLLLNSSPSVPTHDSPTLTKLLGSSLGLVGPQPSTSSSVPLTPTLTVPTPTASPVKVPSPIKEEKEFKPSVTERPAPTPTYVAPVPAVTLPSVTSVEHSIKKAEVNFDAIAKSEPDRPSTPETVLEDLVESVIESEIVIEQEVQNEKRKAVPRRLDMEMETVDTEEEVMVTVEQIIEKVEEAIIETVGGSSEICDVGMNQTLESEALDDNIDSLELDHDAVELIVMGPNQGPVIAVRHDTSSETNNEDSNKSDDVKGSNLTDSLNEIESIIDDDDDDDDSNHKEKTLTPEPTVGFDKKESEIGKEESDEEEIGSIEVEKEQEKVAVETPEPLLIEEKVVEKLILEEKESESSPESVDIESVKEDKPETDSLEIDSKKESSESDDKETESTEIKLEATSVEESNDGYSTSEIKSVNSSNDEDKDIMSTEDSQPESIKKEIIDKPSGESKPSQSKPQKLDSIKEEMAPIKITKAEGKIKHTVEMTPTVIENRENKEPESEKRRTGRKRQSLSSLSDSKPSSPSPSTVSNDDDRDYKLWKKSILLVYNRLAAHRFASVFLKPITEAEATGYHSVVLRPIDLTTIKRNIENGTIRTTVEFQRDMLLMAQNAIMYNKSDTLVYKMAQDMLEDMHAQMEVMVQALGDGVPLGRETEEKLLTRGRASKSLTDETPKRKRISIVEETPRSTKRKRSDLPS